MRAFIIFLFCSCTSLTLESRESHNPAELQSQGVVYGNDDRMDVYAHSDAELQRRARLSAVALMFPDNIDTSDPAQVQTKSRTLGEARKLCEDQRFRNDPTAAYCSGTLIGDDLVLTAGHCMPDQGMCDAVSIVFNYLRETHDGPIALTSDDVFYCRDLIVREQAGRGADYALFRLDRAATPRFEPAPLRLTGELMQKGEGVAVIGCGSGVPQKIDSGGIVRNAREAERDFFVTNTDTFVSNSGSGVYALSDHTLVGVLVRGDADYVMRDECAVVKTCAEDKCRGEDVTYLHKAIHGLCKKSPADMPAVCPPLPPLIRRGELAFDVSHTGSAQHSTADIRVILASGQTLDVGTCFVDGAHGQGDTIIRVTDPAGSEIAVNDDTIAMLSYTEVVAQMDGEHIIRIGCFENTPCEGTAVYEVRDR